MHTPILDNKQNVMLIISLPIMVLQIWALQFWSEKLTSSSYKWHYIEPWTVTLAYPKYVHYIRIRLTPVVQYEWNWTRSRLRLFLKLSEASLTLLKRNDIFSGLPPWPGRECRVRKKTYNSCFLKNF